MGLLDQSQASERRQVESKRNPVLLAKTLLAKAQPNPSTLDYLGEVFEIFYQTLGFQKAVLMLLKEDDSVYIPWINKGFDQTTLRRLFLSSEFFHSRDQKNYVLNEEELYSLAPVFSNRELGLARDEGILLNILGSGKISPALLLATGFSAFSKNTDSLLLASEYLTTFFRESMDSNRIFRQSYQDEENLPPVDWLISWEKGEEGNILVINTANSVSFLLEKFPFLEPSCVQHDVFALVQNIIGRMGHLHKLPDGRGFVFFPDKYLPDQELYLHQFTRNLGRAYGRLTEPPELSASFLRWPQDRQKVEKMILSTP